MYSASFEYTRAVSWADAVERLTSGGDEARVIAGGQSLVPMMTLRLAQPELLIDVGAADERRIERRDGALAVSALVRHVDLERSDVVRTLCPMLAEAAGQIGNVRVRHRGTIGGSLAHGESTAELATVAVAAGATVEVLGPAGERTIPAHELFVTHLVTSLAPDEVITEIRFPSAGQRSGSCFTEIARRAGDFAIAEAASIVTLDGDGCCASARLVVGAVSDRPLDVSDAAQALIGRRPDEGVVAEIARSVAAGVQIGPHTHAGRDYRRRLVEVLVSRSLQTAARRATADNEERTGAQA